MSADERDDVPPADADEVTGSEPSTDEVTGSEPSTDEVTGSEPSTDEADDRLVDTEPDPEPDTEPDAEPVTATTRRTTAAGAAASRARRIGGRVPTVPGTPAADGSADTVSRSGVRLDKPAAADDDGSTDDVDATDVIATGEKPAKATGSKKSGRRTRSTRSSRSKRKGQGTPTRTPAPLAAWIPAAVLAGAAVVMGVLVIIRAVDTSPSTNETRDHVLAAAKSCLVATNAYKYTDITGFEKRGLACATGDFAKEFKSSVDDILKKQAPQVKQVQSLQINAAGIRDITDHNEWDLLVYGQLSVTNTSSSNEIDPFGAVVRMTQVKGKWVIESLCSQSYNGSASRCF